MHRLHAVVISLLLAGAAVAGASAAFRTVSLGPTAAKPATVPERVVAARRAKLDRWSAQLEHARASRPPALPKVPRFAPVVVPTVPATQLAVRSASAPRPPARTEAAPPKQAVTYVQAPPKIQYVQPPAAPAQTTTTSHESEHESDQEDGGYAGGHDDGGEGD
jgi:hypothetical protein